MFLENGTFKINDIRISDSACTAFVTFRKDWLCNFQTANEIFQTAQTESVVAITGKGTLRCRMNGKIHEIPDVLYSPDFVFNLFPVQYFDKKGYKTVFENGEVTITGVDEFVGSGQLHESGLLNGLYVLDLEIKTTQKHYCPLRNNLIMPISHYNYFGNYIEDLDIFTVNNSC
jgi:hypothetical protein